MDAAQITFASRFADRAPYILFGMILGVLLAAILFNVFLDCWDAGRGRPPHNPTGKQPDKQPNQGEKSDEKQH